MDRGKKPQPIYKLERKGTFQFDSYCWTDGPKELSFEITITTKQLDDEGFVFDNRKIEEYFRENFEGKQVKVSCERLAETILFYLCEALPNCEGCCVRVSGNPDATWLSASFVRDEDAAASIPALSHSIQKQGGGLNETL